MSSCESDNVQAMCRALAALPAGDDEPGDDQVGDPSWPILTKSLTAPQLEHLNPSAGATGGSFRAASDRLGKLGVL